MGGFFVGVAWYRGILAVLFWLLRVFFFLEGAAVVCFGLPVESLYINS